MAGFLRHRGLIAFSASGAMLEAGVLTFLAPWARPLAPQVTALPPLAAYHDLRWLFALNQPWPAFTVVLVLSLLARSAVDAALLMLAWPRQSDGGVAEIPGAAAIPRPRFLGSLLSCAVLTMLVWLVMSPVVTLMFGVALLPFSWPFLAALPILLGTALALSHGGVGQTWWRRLPPAPTAAWLFATFVTMSAAAAFMTRLDTAGIIVVAGLAGVINARAWYGLTLVAVRRSAEQPPQAWAWRAALWRIRHGLRDRMSWLPVAPLAAFLVLALVVGTARLLFTGTLHLNLGTSGIATEAIAANNVELPGIPAAPGPPGPTPGPARVHGALLVVAGFGSTCCHDANALRAAEPGMLVRQFSYQGLNAAGNPVPYAKPAGDLPIQTLGDRMAVQLEWLYRHARAPVDVVAESEGTLGVYAMLARHPHVPIGSVVLLSPIVKPGQLGQADGTVPGDLLNALNNLVGGMSPYGSSGAGALLDSVSQVGARYFEMVSRDQRVPWLAVVPLADAVTLPACSWPSHVIFVAAFHGGLLGDPGVRQLTVSFFSDGAVPAGVSASQAGLRSEVQLISAASAAWRMPQVAAPCPFAPSG
ncbi:MAG TPA: hypothetical protein VME19_11745 [Streptosporangiaceae bacterium]|nr:hypothetical protein [Streptosporangiaceae bacterium]